MIDVSLLTNPSMRMLVGAVIGYLLGGIPFAIVIGKGLFGVDVREHGSGNTGTTNVVRTLGWKPGVAVLVCDIAKGSLSVLIMLLLISGIDVTHTMYQVALVIAGAVAIAGHMHSPYINLAGGKGVATAFGALLFIIPKCALLGIVLFLIVAIPSRYVSLGSLIAAITLPFSVLLLYPDSYIFFVFCTVAAVFVIYAHRRNALALLRGEERKFSVGNRSSKPGDAGDGEGTNGDAGKR